MKQAVQTEYDLYTEYDKLKRVEQTSRKLYLLVWQSVCDGVGEEKEKKQARKKGR